MMNKRHTIWRRLQIIVASAALLLAGLPVPAGAANTTWDADTNLELTGSGITLVILSGAQADSLSVGTTDFTVTVASGESFTIRYPATYGTLTNDGGLIDCNIVGNNIEATVANATVTFTPTTTPCTPPSSGGGGGGGGGGASSSPTLTVITPNGGESLAPGTTHLVQWSTFGGTQILATLTLSTDGGSTYPITIVDDEPNDGLYNWTVPDIGTTSARLRIETTGLFEAVQTSDSSNADFSITGTVPTTTEEEPAPELISETTEGEELTLAELEAAAPATDSTSSGSYSPAEATDATPTINVDLGLEEPEGDETPACEAGTLIKGESSSTVYYCGKDVKRYVFPNEHVFYTWFEDFSSVSVLTDSELASLPLAGNVTYKPGVRMIKITSDPKTYAVSRGGLLRWVETEEVAVALYGTDWNTKIDDVDPAYFFSYGFGDPITAADAGL